MKLSPFTKKVIFWTSAYTLIIRGLTIYVLSLESDLVINPASISSSTTDTSLKTSTPNGAFRI